MRALFRRLQRRYSLRMSAERLEPIPLNEIVAGCEGNWVAIKNGVVVQAAPTPGLLSLRLHDAEIKNATIVRARPLEETELVGLG